MGKQVEIIINEKGDLQIDTLNFEGSECEDVQKSLADRLGQTIQSTDKPEKLNNAIITNQNRQSVQ